MKDNELHDNRRLKGSTPDSAEGNSLKSNASTVMRVSLLVLCAAGALALLTGCASARVQEDADPWQYNPNTGYPAVGGPSWGHF